MASKFKTNTKNGAYYVVEAGNVNKKQKTKWKKRIANIVKIQNKSELNYKDFICTPLSQLFTNGWYGNLKQLETSNHGCYERREYQKNASEIAIVRCLPVFYCFLAF